MDTKSRAIGNGAAKSFCSGDAAGMFAVMTDVILVLTNITLTAIQYGKTMTMHKNLPHYDGAKYVDHKNTELRSATIVRAVNKNRKQNRIKRK